MNLSFVLLLAYLLAQFVICYLVSRKIKNEEDFLLAGRSLGTPLITLSLFATWFGAETCIGSSAEVFTNGLSGSRADPFGYSLCLVLSGLLIAPKIWRKQYTTLADVYANNFGPRTERLAVWILSLSSLIWAAAQLRAFGQVVASTTDLSVDFTLFISFVFVVGYVLYGGLMGDIITDSLQAVVIFLGLSALCFYIFKDHPDIFSIAINQPSERLSIISPGESLFQRMDRWAIPILGSLVAQEVISRMLAAKNIKVATRSCHYAAGVYIILGCIPVFFGLVGPDIMSLDGTNNEQFIIALANKFLPLFMLPIFAGALVSALLATIDSILISVSGLIAHNFIIPKFRIKKDQSKVLVTRFAVVGSASIAYVLAYYSESIYSLLEVASSFGTSGILIITIAGLWFKSSSDLRALTTLIIGLISTPIFDYVLEIEAPFISSILICLIVYVTFPLIWSFVFKPIFQIRSSSV